MCVRPKSQQCICCVRTTHSRSHFIQRIPSALATLFMGNWSFRLFSFVDLIERQNRSDNNNRFDFRHPSILLNVKLPNGTQSSSQRDEKPNKGSVNRPWFPKHSTHHPHSARRSVRENTTEIPSANLNLLSNWIVRISMENFDRNKIEEMLRAAARLNMVLCLNFTFYYNGSCQSSRQYNER